MRAITSRRWRPTAWRNVRPSQIGGRGASGEQGPRARLARGDASNHESTLAADSLAQRSTKPDRRPRREWRAGAPRAVSAWGCEQSRVDAGGRQLGATFDQARSEAAARVASRGPARG